MHKNRTTLVLPADPEYQAALAVLVGRLCLLTRRVWSPLTLSSMLARALLDPVMQRHYRDILFYNKIRLEASDYVPAIEPHTRFLSLTPDIIENLDTLVILIRAHVGYTKGIYRTGITIAIFEWASNLTASDLEGLVGASEQGQKG